MTDRVPSFPLLVPGPWASAKALADQLRAAGQPVTEPDAEPFAAGAVDVSLVEGPGLGAAVVEAGGPFAEDVAAQLAETDRAALIEVGWRLDENPSALADLGRALRDAGGLAVRMERSGRSFAWDVWLEALGSGERHGLIGLAVVLVEDDAGFVYSVGMHHFDLPDAQIAVDGDLDEAAHWVGTFHEFVLFESPVIATGHTFRPDDESPKRVLERWPDHRHQPDDGRANPFGVWRILGVGEAGVPPSDETFLAIPSMAATLGAKEDEAGRRLTQAEVEALRDEMPGSMVGHEVAAQLEQARGYADLEPELVWPQWQIVREHISR